MTVEVGTPEILDRPSEVVDCLEIFDVDRNLLNTEAFAKIVEDTLESQGITIDEFKTIREKIERSGGSFDIFTELRKLYDKSLADEVVHDVRTEAMSRIDLDYSDERCLFNPGARELIRGEMPGGTKRAYVTRGGSETQLLKFDALGIDLNNELYSVLPPDGKMKKAAMCVEAFDLSTDTFMFRWLHMGRSEEGVGSSLVDVRARRVIITDDKDTELVELGKLGKHKAIGFWHNTKGGTEDQKSLGGKPFPDNIFEIKSFYEIGAFLSRLGRVALGANKEWAGKNLLSKKTNEAS